MLTETLWQTLAAAHNGRVGANNLEPALGGLDLYTPFEKVFEELVERFGLEPVGHRTLDEWFDTMAGLTTSAWELQKDFRVTRNQHLLTW